MRQRHVRVVVTHRNGGLARSHIDGGECRALRPARRVGVVAPRPQECGYQERDGGHSSRINRGADQPPRVAYRGEGEYRDQIDAADNALQELEAAVTNVNSGGVGPVVTAAGNVVTTGGALLDSLRNLNCG